MEFPNQHHTAYAQFVYPAGYAGSVPQDPSETAEAQTGSSQPQTQVPLSWDHGAHHQDLYGRPMTADSSIKQASIDSPSIEGSSPEQHHQHQHPHQPQQQHHRHHHQPAPSQCSHYCSPSPQNLYLDLNQAIVLPTTIASPGASPYHQPVLPSQHILPDLSPSVPTNSPQSQYPFHDQYTPSSLRFHSTAPTPQTSSPHGSPLLTSAYEQAEQSMHLQNGLVNIANPTSSYDGGATTTSSSSSIVTTVIILIVATINNVINHCDINIQPSTSHTNRETNNNTGSLHVLLTQLRALIHEGIRFEQTHLNGPLHAAIA
ncbi:hypothetical protein KEM54_003007 [Ascosphaera aggregata]|nr:hypothetical protein KEM54_003007 [Ascosphaera aggregata]